MIFCARATRGLRRPSPGLMARLGVPVGGRVRKTRAMEDHSVLQSEGSSMRALGDRAGCPVVEKIAEVMRGGNRG
jgi:hypothetical protein